MKNVIRRASVLTLATALTTIGVTVAVAEPQPIPASIGSVSVSADRVTGVLNLRPGRQVATLDGTLTAELGEKDAAVSTRPAAQGPRTTVLLIDTSGSMDTQGMSTVRTAVRAFLAEVPKDVRVGVVSFGTTAGPEVAPTTNRAAVQKVVDALRSNGNTALFEGVRQAVTMLGTTGDRSVVLLSDGKNTIGDRTEGLNAATSALTRSRVRVEVVRFTTSENDPAALAAFAKAGGGSVANATDTTAVRAAFRAAAQIFESQTSFDVTRPQGLTGSVPIVLRGTASGRPFEARTTVDLGARPSLAPSATPVIVEDVASGSTVLKRVPTETNWWLIAGLVSLFLGGLALIIGLADPFFRSRREERVAQIEQYTLGQFGPAGRRVEATPSAMAESIVRVGDRVMDGRASTTLTMELIRRADLPLRAGEWWVLRLVAVVVGAAVLGLFAPVPPWLGMPVGALMGFLLPAVVLRALAERRARAFEALLPDIMMLIATTLASGFSLPQALDAVARDAADPAGPEFSRAVAETRIGVEVSDALDHLAHRMDSENLKWTTMAIRIQRDVGGNLAETLRTTAHTLRERAALQRQVRTLSAEGRMSAWILIALPIVMFFFFVWRRPEYVALLWTTFPGLVMLVASVIGMIVGTFWMRSVVRIEV